MNKINNEGVLALRKMKELNCIVTSALEKVEEQERLICEQFCPVKVGDEVVGNTPMTSNVLMKVEYIKFNQKYREFHLHGGTKSNVCGRAIISLDENLLPVINWLCI